MSKKVFIPPVPKGNRGFEYTNFADFFKDVPIVDVGPESDLERKHSERLIAAEEARRKEFERMTAAHREQQVKARIAENKQLAAQIEAILNAPPETPGTSTIGLRQLIANVKQSLETHRKHGALGRITVNGQSWTEYFPANVTYEFWEK